MKMTRGLSLSREVVRDLTPVEMGGAGGGQTVPTTRTHLNLSWCLCNSAIDCYNTELCNTLQAG